MLKRFKTSNEKKEVKLDFSLEDVQRLFNMQDICKDYKMHAITPTQLESIQSAEIYINNIIKKLYVPDYQSKNI